MKNADTGKIGLLASSTILIGGMFGSAIFSLSGLTITIAGPSAMLSWVIAAAILFLYGLISAELSTIYPDSGVVYMFPAKSLGKSPGSGRLWGWISGWAYIFGCFGGASFSASYIGIYLGVTFPAMSGWQIPVAIGVILVCGLLNASGVKAAGRASTIMAAGLITAMVAFIIAGLFSGSWDAGNMRPFFPAGAGSLSFMSAVPLAMVAYSSVVAVSFMVGEIRNPKKTVPLAMTIAMIVVVSMYLLIMLTTLGLVTAEYLLDTGMQYVPLYAAAYRSLTNLPWVPYVISAAAVLALANNIMVLGALLIRTLQAMASSGLLPQVLTKQSRLGATPPAAVAVVVIVMSLLASIPNATNFIIGMGTLCSAIVVVLICMSVLAARKKNPEASRFKAPGGNVMPIALMLVIVACYIPNILAGGWQIWACSAAYFAVGLGVYRLRKGKTRAH